ncbi:hypothetical protein T484DRAFT_1781232 [Baffinella frigidus]|nr:hypothetical protein T484DRAFT_1781232 [Cryptophyta sp. CCMP2293]
MADDEEEAPDAMERKVQITVEVSCRKGDPISELVATPRSSTGENPGKQPKGGEAGGAGPGEDAEPPEPRPTFAELGCKFHLTMFNGFVAESAKLDFVDPAVEGEEEGGEEGEMGETVDPSLWKHSFTFEAVMNEDEIVKLCRQPESSISLRKEGLEDEIVKLCHQPQSFISLRKEGLEVPMVLLPICLAQMVSGDLEFEVGASLASTELIQNPYNVGEFVVRISVDKKLLTPSLEDKLNPLTINIVAAETP